MTCTRRRFLSTTAGIAAATGLSTAFAEDRKPAAVSFGFSLYGMRKLPLAKALAVCKTVGYDCVELVANKDWPCDPQKLSKMQRADLRKRLDGLGLSCAALMENVHLTADAKTHRGNLDRLKRAAELAHDVDPKAPPVIETVLGGRPAQWDKLKDRMAERLRDWAKVAEAAKTAIAIKAHVGGAVHTPPDAVWLMQSAKSPFIRLAYDYSHFQLWDFKLADSLQAMIGTTAFIHVKDSRGKRPRFQFVLPGQGSIDYAGYFSLLKKHRYRGPLVVEVSGQLHGKPGYDPFAAATTSYNNLAPKLRGAGIRQ
jgi:inosose dehydratase